jgi:4-amino-4-deoxychorismate lyase
MSVDLLFLNGELVNQNDRVINFQDRAFHYGDGVFETLRIHQGDIPTWPFHRERLLSAQEKLKLPLASFFSEWEGFVETHLGSIESGCAKLVVCRGIGPRGYRPPNPVSINWWLQISELPASSLSLEQDGKALTLCSHKLSRQPVLAGLKHLNRLDQVLARSEWGGLTEFDEGIMFNLDGCVVEGTMSNIFWLEGQQIFTPDLSLEGVDGCVRRWIIEHKLNSTHPVKIIKSVDLNHLVSADAVFISNSLSGIRGVNRIADTKIPMSVLVNDLALEFNRYYR